MWPDSIATWATLRALVIQVATGEHEVPDAHYRTLEAQRAPLPKSQIWLGALDGTDGHTAFFLGATLDANDAAEPDGYVATFALGKLIGRVFVLTEGRGEFGSASNGALDGDLVSIWPSVPSAAWPPKALDFDGYARLVATLPTAFVAQRPAPTEGSA